MANPDARVAVVTGGAGGIGLAIARRLPTRPSLPGRHHRSGRHPIISARQLADAYGVTDTDGSKPDCRGYLAAYGRERDGGAGIDDFR